MDCEKNKRNAFWYANIHLIWLEHQPDQTVSISNSSESIIEKYTKIIDISWTLYIICVHGLGVKYISAIF